MDSLTIKDIARMAGVSVSTVSRTINNNYPVSEEARERVETVLRENHYRPNGVARSLRSNKTHLVALIIPELSNLFFMRIAQGIERVLSRHGYSCAIASSERDAEKERKLVELFLERRIDGLVIASADLAGGNVAHCLASGVPVVMFDRNAPVKGCSKVLWNNKGGAAKLTGHLIEEGHRKIGMINVSLKNENGQERLRGYRETLATANIAEKAEYVSDSNVCIEEAFESVMKMMSLPDPPTALVCANEIVLEGTMRALGKLGQPIGKDISVVAFGSCECNRYINTRITTVEQDCEAMGVLTGQFMQQSLGNKKGKTEVHVMEPQLVMRESVKRLS